MEEEESDSSKMSSHIQTCAVAHTRPHEYRGVCTSVYMNTHTLKIFVKYNVSGNRKKSLGVDLWFQRPMHTLGVKGTDK